MPVSVQGQCRTALGHHHRSHTVLIRACSHAWSLLASLQGCMNNFTFGDSQMGYYETICGGAGAGPGWHGRSGVHTHMTNTRWVLKPTVCFWQHVLDDGLRFMG